MELKVMECSLPFEEGESGLFFRKEGDVIQVVDEEGILVDRFVDERIGDDEEGFKERCKEWMSY